MTLKNFFRNALAAGAFAACMTASGNADAQIAPPNFTVINTLPCAVDVNVLMFCSTCPGGVPTGANGFTLGASGGTYVFTAPDYISAGGGSMQPPRTNVEVNITDIDGFPLNLALWPVPPGASNSISTNYSSPTNNVTPFINALSTCTTANITWGINNITITP